jgi:hypothetical protein
MDKVIKIHLYIHNRAGMLGIFEYRHELEGKEKAE